ncbi:MAG: hypothetical protein VX498_12020 [Myxococcota bacterium]|nr:hypothetical protein [Myxococcota bacterium]
MGGSRSSWTLGGASLGLSMSGVVLVTAWLGSSQPPVPDFPVPAELPSSHSAVLLGWPVACDEPDPAVWAALSGVGPVRGAALAELAVAGKLRSPTDLLRVRGIGIKMAAQIAPWVRWPSAGDQRVGADMSAPTP